MKKTLDILVGISASGKSTYCDATIRERLMEDFQVPMPAMYTDPTLVLNADQIRGEIYGDPMCQDNPKRVFSILEDRLHAALKDDTTDYIIVDNTSLQRKTRKRYIDLALTVCPMFEHEVEIRVIFFEPNLERSLEWNKKRDRNVPEDVIEAQVDRYQGPGDFEREHCTILDISFGPRNV